jgi:hypothetical protein
MGKNRSAYGDDIIQGPLWVRPQSLLEDGLNYIHIVGHTQKRNITSVLDENNYGYILVDTLGGGEYLEILIPEEGNIVINTVLI